MEGTRRNFQWKEAGSHPSRALIALSRHLIVFDVRVGYVSNPHDHTGQLERTGLKNVCEAWKLSSCAKTDAPVNMKLLFQEPREK